MAWKRDTIWSRISSLAAFDESSIGPIQRDEAIFLYGLVRSIRPKVAVEIGFAQGHSAFTFLLALDPDATLWSVDSDPYARDLHRRYFANDPRSRFQFCDQIELDTSVFGTPIDLVFFDGSHDLDSNCLTFERIRPKLSKDALILIHDTGVWNKAYMEQQHWDVLPELDHVDRGNGIIHQVGERRFVEWLVGRIPDAQMVHIHSQNTLRHGLSLIRLGNRALSQD